nr:ATP-dependent RNA helicase DEAH11, chloroplastic-like [Populus alba]XP_034923083.1 ATP-dependent RNA helicase DEAH11, chloroplastic-like [Populus alba]
MGQNVELQGNRETLQISFGWMTLTLVLGLWIFSIVLLGYTSVRCNLERNDNGSYRVQISANATKTAAELRRLLEQLMNGKTVNHGSLTPIVLQLLSSRDSIMLMKSVQQQMGTCILFDRQNLTIRIFGPVNQVALTEQKLVASLLALRDKQQTDIRL